MDGFSGRPVPQRADELDLFVKLLLSEGVKTYLEIGSRFGDSLHAVGSGLKRGSTLMAVDLPGAAWGDDESQTYLEAAARDLTGKGRKTEVIIGNSTAPETLARVGDAAPFDAIFIDGDHTLDGVTKDWKAYRGLGRIIAFHDIDATVATKGKKAKRYGVNHLWTRLKADHKHVEIIGAQRGMGIGVLWRPAA